MKKMKAMKRLLKKRSLDPQEGIPFHIRHPRLRILSFNAENLFVNLDFYHGQSIERLSESEWQRLHYGPVPLKPLYKLKSLSQHILGLDPDVIFLSEVGGPSSLEHFNKLFLKDSYIPLLLESNSERGIDLGYLIRRTLPVRFQLKTHKDTPLPLMPQAKFSRDVLELRLFCDHHPDPLLILLGVHLKSQLDPQGEDPHGRQRRKAELHALLEIVKEIEGEFSGKVPYALAGDFNGRAWRPYPDPEFSQIYERTRLLDCLEVINRPFEQRITHFFFGPFGLIERMQFDYIFVSSHLHRSIVKEETYVAAFPGSTLSPRGREDIQGQPSDHFPVLLTIKTRNI